MEGPLSPICKMKGKAIIFVDGSSRGNPGPCGGAFVIYNEKGEEIERRSFKLPYGTNNMAEYMAVIEALKRALELGYKNLHIKSDSELIINQLNGISFPYKAIHENKRIVWKDGKGPL